MTGRLGGESQPAATRCSVSSESQWRTFAWIRKTPSNSPASSGSRNDGEPGRVVELVAVDAQRPRLGAHERLEHAVRLARVAHAADVQVVELGRELAEDVPGLVRGHVVDGEDPVAEAGDVPDRLLDVQVLVADERDPDDLQGVSPPRSSTRAAA